MYKLLLLLFLTSILSAIAIDVYNDSPYTLQAKIYSVKNVELSLMTVISSHSIKWSDSYYDAKDCSEGKFRVIFTCPNGDFYGKSSPVGQNNSTRSAHTRPEKMQCSHSNQRLIGITAISNPM
ncbi:hypothetical protein [Candidatus Neptunichlamydia sp. REUL1]|uniref:hypothetical protein n=1 Tax=Candidatus Neptunichlamydia sp. REUL1 TaxID=3064277 RepID=UPI00292E4FE9|nr:hypothetical protein [Candidatus Neptunochlamydia sp. REUL1]